MPTAPEAPFLSLLRGLLREAGAEGWSAVQSARAPAWVVVHPDGDCLPAQGWKLHVSAGPPSAEDVLRRSLPALLAERVRFKVAASPAALQSLGEGAANLSQAGKFLTVYPTDDAQAVRLAVALDAATGGLRGPAIASDRPLRPGSLVHYRYGGFTGRHLQTPLGESLPAIADPDGALIPDERRPFYTQPDWVTDPFLAAGVAAAPDEPNGLIGGRYLLTNALHRSASGGVFLAVDVDHARRCVVKRASRDATLSRDGLDARDRLRREADVLARLAPDPAFPAVYELLEHDGDLYLAMEDVEGETLERAVFRRAREACPAPSALVAAWGRALAGALGRMHARGLIHRDVKSSNVLLTPDGRLFLLDMEIAEEASDTVRPRWLGTRGYLSPQQWEGCPPAITDDVYSLGALLFFAGTAAEPSQAPQLLNLPDRPLRLLNPALGPALERVILRCLHPDPADRFPDMAALGDALAVAESQPVPPPPPFGGEEGGPDGAAQAWASVSAHRLGDTLCRVAQPAPGGGLVWRDSRDAGDTPSRDLNLGSSGAVLALAELAAAFGVPEHRQALADGAGWLADIPRPEGRALPGLYVGEAGAGAALLRAGQALREARLIDAASAVGRWVAAQPFTSPDLFNGTAGRLRFHLLLWDETEDPDALRDARAAGDVLCAAAQDDGAGGAFWRMPPGYRGLSETASLGYAHGAAGIADALLELHEATGDEHPRALAARTAGWLARQALPALDDGSGACWPAAEGAGPFSAFWCHGAGGIGRFFLRAGLADLQPGAADLAARAARTTARGIRWAGPAQCHGLAGSIELLLDMFQATGDPAYRAEAHSLARLLRAFASERPEGLAWPADTPGVFIPTYMTGYAGVALCLLRLADPARRPHQLSRRGFRHLPTTHAEHT